VVIFKLPPRHNKAGKEKLGPRRRRLSPRSRVVPASPRDPGHFSFFSLPSRSSSSRSSRRNNKVNINVYAVTPKRGSRLLSNGGLVFAAVLCWWIWPSRTYSETFTISLPPSPVLGVFATAACSFRFIVFFRSELLTSRRRREKKKEGTRESLPQRRGTRVRVTPMQNGNDRLTVGRAMNGWTFDDDDDIAVEGEFAAAAARKTRQHGHDGPGRGADENK